MFLAREARTLINGAFEARRGLVTLLKSGATDRHAKYDLDVGARQTEERVCE